MFCHALKTFARSCVVSLLLVGDGLGKLVKRSGPLGGGWPEVVLRQVFVGGAVRLGGGGHADVA